MVISQLYDSQLTHKCSAHHLIICFKYKSDSHLSDFYYCFSKKRKENYY